MTVLITGFGPFDGGSNASEVLVRAAERRREALGARMPVEIIVLPVDTARAGDLLTEAVERVRPARLLMTGQAAGRNRLGLEKIATNRRDFRVPDVQGAQPGGVPVLETGPDMHVATWPDLEATAAALNAAGIPAEVSEDCGTHLCNQLLYLALHAARESGRSYLATFLHVPLLPEQVIAGEPAAQRHPNCPYMPLDMTLRGLQIVLERAAALGAAA
jgi:pyroglutamyl-peptidase